MVNFTALGEWQGPNITEEISKIDNIQEELPKVANDTSDGLFGIVIMSGFFFFLLYIFTREDWVFRYSLDKAIVIASAIVLTIGTMGVLTGIFNNWRHVMIYGVVFVVSTLWNHLKNNLQ